MARRHHSDVSAVEFGERRHADRRARRAPRPGASRARLTAVLATCVLTVSVLGRLAVVETGGADRAAARRDLVELSILRAEAMSLTFDAQLAVYRSVEGGDRADRAAIGRILDRWRDSMAEVADRVRSTSPEPG